jgi:hypothetical protein
MHLNIKENFESATIEKEIVDAVCRITKETCPFFKDESIKCEDCKINE